MRRTGVALALLALALPSGASAQLALMPRIGTTGLGADIAYSVSDMLVLRAGGAVMPYDPEFNISDIDWSAKLPSTAKLAADLHLAGSGFRISGGLFLLLDDPSFSGVLADSVQVGRRKYAPSELGQLDGTVEYSGTSPFVSLGYGRAAGSGVGFFIELGAALVGDPTVGLSHSGGNLSESRRQQLEEDLQEETREFQEDLQDLDLYPILNIGVRIGL